eukprot:scaffold170498_cov48-Prasinocladus_malaysianus.AAC.2
MAEAVGTVCGWEVAVCRLFRTIGWPPIWLLSFFSFMADAGRDLSREAVEWQILASLGMRIDT